MAKSKEETKFGIVLIVESSSMYCVSCMSSESYLSGKTLILMKISNIVLNT